MSLVGGKDRWGDSKCRSLFQAPPGAQAETLSVLRMKAARGKEFSSLLFTADADADADADAQGLEGWLGDHKGSRTTCWIGG